MRLFNACKTNNANYFFPGNAFTFQHNIPMNVAVFNKYKDCRGFQKVVPKLTEYPVSVSLMFMVIIIVIV